MKKQYSGKISDTSISFTIRKKKPKKELLISKKARVLYGIDEELFSKQGELIFASMFTAHKAVVAINKKRNIREFPELAVRLSDFFAAGLLHEIEHLVIEKYLSETNPKAIAEATNILKEVFGEKEVDNVIRNFLEDFPPQSILNGEKNVDEYLAEEIDGKPAKEFVLEELILLWLENNNPALDRFRELFDDSDLQSNTRYHQIMEDLENIFKEQPKFVNKDQTLIELLKEPIKHSPHSLIGQIEFIAENWADIVEPILLKILKALDIAKEEEKLRGPGKGKIRAYTYEGLPEEAYSKDTDWMPNVVLIAKITYVWLDQLSKKYRREIKRLDQIPDEELDLLRERGINALWLIGVWERSPASKKIKHLTGMLDAEGSAYSIYEYVISSDLGGYEAFQELKGRAELRGIRLAGDMVPNHTGIDAKWVSEHPEWYIQVDQPPFPSYTFNGPNLSNNPRIGIYLEDHYYDNTDAAVVFKRVDFETGKERYIYHGNDGTQMPWNDTAQLNYLLPEVRKAIIDVIIQIAKLFPIIRFDAAMTLTKKHFQRLWFPIPGSGGDIPSRAEFAMTKEEFDRHMPREFWREVVDKIAEEAPDTLLLAEAFWLLEGYFVRVLGIHRVYNSAFMNMLKAEENKEYRKLIKNALEFDPRILKRFVNFMNNPDEETAVVQFGKGDKYFGVCTLLATLPGLPMIGHGQIEGFREKYGMEFRKPRIEEQEDIDFIKNHERLIFPLLRKRFIFSEVNNFNFYDFVKSNGDIDEDVFAYSNKHGKEISLIIYNNTYKETSGSVSLGVPVRELNSDQPRLIQKSLAESLRLRCDEDYYLLFRDHVTGLEYIRKNVDIEKHGLFLELRAYEFHVFWEFKQVKDNKWKHYEQLRAYLGEKGVPNIAKALQEVILAPLHQAFVEAFRPSVFEMLFDIVENKKTFAIPESAFYAVAKVQNRVIVAIQKQKKVGINDKEIRERMRTALSQVLSLFPALEEETLPLSKIARDLVKQLIDTQRKPMLFNLLSWMLLHAFGRIRQNQWKDVALINVSWYDEWFLRDILRGLWRSLSLPEDEREVSLSMIRTLLSLTHIFVEEYNEKEIITEVISLFDYPEVQVLLGVNRFNGILWFNKEAWNKLLANVLALGIASTINPERGRQIKEERVKTWNIIIEKLYTTARDANYQLETFQKALFS